MIPGLVFASQNPIKIEEASHFLGPFRVVDWHLTEEQHVDPADVVRGKVGQAWAMAGADDVVVVEDTGLAVDGWNGLPGALVRSFVDRLGPDGLARILGTGTAATAQSSVAVAVTEGNRLWSAGLRGRIVDPRGELGGWTSIFEVAGTGLTLAEMDLTRRLRVTMRRDPLLSARAWIDAVHGARPPGRDDRRVRP